jgi:aspartate dehydrogenase
MARLAPQKKSSSRFAIIGCGAIGYEIVRCLEARGEADSLVGILDLPDRIPALKKQLGGRFPVVDAIESLISCDPDIIVEAAGHGAVRRFGLEILQHGIDLLVASVGVFADRGFVREFVAAANAGAEVWIAAGAVAGIDGLLAARTLGPHSVTYISLKPPVAWRGTPAEPLLADRQSDRFVFFKGSAREAATLYPQNANVAATVALACLGLDRTEVQLVSEPSVSGPVGVIEAIGDFGRFNFEILALASPSNPKTSAITGHSLVSAVHDGMRFPALDRLRESF